MLKRAGRYVFFIAVYLSGILIGGIYTSEVISYAKQVNAQKEIEKRENLPKPPRPEKKRAASIRLG